MAWERRGKHRFYYHSRRVNGRVIKEYFGRGPMAEAAAALFEARREAQRHAKQRRQDAKRTLQAADEAVDRLRDATRMADTAQTLPFPRQQQGRPYPALRQDSPEDVVSHFKQLLAARSSGDEAAEPKIRAILEQFPELWPQLGDLGAQAIEVWLNLASGPDALMKQAIRTKLVALRDSFQADAHDPGAQLLADRVAVTWLQVQYADLRVSQAGDATRVNLEFLARRQEQAQRQYLRALKEWRVWQQWARPATESTSAPVERNSTASTSYHQAPDPFLVPYSALSGKPQLPARSG